VLVAKKMLGLQPSKSRELRKNYSSFLEGLISFPIYFPGTTFYQCMQVCNNFYVSHTDYVIILHNIFFILNIYAIQLLNCNNISI